MSRISNTPSIPTPVNFCGGSGSGKIKNKFVRAMYNRKYGEYTPSRFTVSPADSKFIKGLKNFANILKDLFINP